MGKGRKKREQKGLRVDVRGNNVEGALKIFKRMVKDSELMLELKSRTYYEKPSAKKREKKSAQAARYRYQDKKDKFSY
jgi:small subunit ribosomal protein S21